MTSTAINQPTMTDVEEADSRGIETGCFAPSASEEHFQSKSKLIIATYNIRYAVGSFLITGSFLRRIGLTLPHRRSALVARHLQIAARAFSNNQRMPAPDIIALQEADKNTRRAGTHDIARELANALQMNYARAAMIVPSDAEPKANQWYLDFEEPVLSGETGTTGVAILSRLSFERAARIDLPFHECAWRPRVAVCATFTINNRHIHLFNVHIDPHASAIQQRTQYETILEQASATSAEGDAVVLLGDFNTLTHKSRTSARSFLESRGYQTILPSGTPTWRAGLFRHHTDWIFTQGVGVGRWGVARPLGVSDHWPVWVEIDTCDDHS